MKRLAEKYILFCFLLIVQFIVMGCSSLGPGATINIDQMDLSPDSSEQYENYAQTIREGGVQINRNNKSGGCGCN